jgi:serine/arginine repetitive matrix protein 1
MDTYIPNGPPRRRSGERRRWSPSFRRSASRSLSRSRSPPRYRPGEDEISSRRRRYTPSRSPTPVRRGVGSGRGRMNLGRGDDRARSFTPSETSRSRSPRRTRRQRSPSILSRSPTPPNRARRDRRRQPSLSPRARSRSLDRDRRRPFRSRRSPSHHMDHEGGDIRANYLKGSRYRNERRRSRSRSRTPNEARGARLPPVTLSQSRSPDKRRDRKRHRSIQRYAPVGRRRRNTSSVSSPVEKRRKTADSSGDEGNRQPPEPTAGSKPKDIREDVRKDGPRAIPNVSEKSEEVGSDS